MHYIILRPVSMVLVLLCAMAVFAAPPSGKQAKTTPIPSFAEVKQTVAQYFEAMPKFRENDLLTRDVVEPLLGKLQKMGLPLADAGQILGKVPSKDEFLADQLSTDRGRQFMRRISGYPGAYDRLDRLSRMPHGEQTIRDLVRGPGGDKMLQYMTTAQGGTELGKQLSNSPTGKQFNEPTGRIYTVTLLLKRLQQSHTAALKAAGKKTSP